MRAAAVRTIYLPSGKRFRRVNQAERTDADGNVFDSKGEMRRWNELLLMQRAGEISDLERQVALPLMIAGNPIKIRSPRYAQGRAVVYIADFRYREPGGVVIEDFKGVWTPEARLKIAIVEAQYGVRVKVTGPAKLIS